MQVKKENADTPVRYIKGVGPKKSEFFNKLGIENISDLFYYLPRRYEDRSNILKVADIKVGETQAVIGKVLKTRSFRAKTGTYICEVEVGEGKRRVFAVWYNLPFMFKVFSSGQTVVLYGKIELYKRLQITHPYYEIVEGKFKSSLDLGRIVPVYSLTEKLNQRYMRKTVDQAMQSYLSLIDDCLPTNLRARRKLVDSKFAIENIHFPYSFDNLDRAYKRLVFEEFFILQVIMAIKRMRSVKDGIKHNVKEGLMREFEDLFDFELTKGQKKCIKEIECDMSSERPMYRLLQGDVGSGKTAVSIYALILSVSNGFQAAMMAPTEILARQHYVTVSQTLMPLGINIRLLVGGIDQRSREKIIEEIRSGEADIIIGTHALLQESIEYSDLGLVVIDEQHKFGVLQRKKLRLKGSMPDTLVMTATPIPRSLILSVFGDMDISVLREKPKEREPVTTYWVDEEKRDAVYDFIRSEISEGRQAFIVYPRIKNTGVLDLRSAEDEFEHLSKHVFNDLRVALVHGRMKSDEKDETMNEFRGGKIDILLATTVIEVGVDVPNVTVMLVEHAERYGLSQLHQLRGRIGRGKHNSYFIIMGDTKTEASEERLATLAETDDGFKIAEKDLDIRGPGEFLGKRQSGLPELRVGNIVRDFAIMEEAREDAFELIKSDPGLDDPHNRGIKAAIQERFKGKLEI